MKGLVGALVAGAAVAALCSAPAEAMELVGQGPKVGIGWAQLENGDESGTVSGVAVGWAVTFEVNDWFAFQPEILYSSKGGEGSILGYDWEADLTYVECHSLAKFTLADEVPKPVVFAGLSLGFNIIKHEVEVNAPSGATDEFDTKVFELGYVLGLGVEFPAGDGIVSADLRFTAGLTHATEDVTRFGVLFPEQKNRTVSFTFGYRF